MHKQVSAKVTAYVDEGIKDLVEILNNIPNVCKLESCQGYNSEYAFVSLEYGIDHNNQDKFDLNALVGFADTLWNHIKRVESQKKVYAGISDCIILSMEWHPIHDPILTVAIDNRFIDAFINILYPLCTERTQNKQQSMCDN